MALHLSGDNFLSSNKTVKLVWKTGI